MLHDTINDTKNDNFDTFLMVIFSTRAQEQMLLFNLRLNKFLVFYLEINLLNI